MPDIIQNGTARILTAQGVMDAYVGVFNESIRGKHVFKTNEILDSSGFWTGEDARNEHIIITISIKLTGATIAAAKANALFLTPLSEVIISGAELEWINTTGVGGRYTGSWCYHEGGDIDLKNDSVGGATISLRKFADPTQNALQFVIPT